MSETTPPVDLTALRKVAEDGYPIHSAEVLALLDHIATLTRSRDGALSAMAAMGEELATAQMERADAERGHDEAIESGWGIFQMLRESQARLAKVQAVKRWPFHGHDPECPPHDVVFATDLDEAIGGDQ